MKPHASTRIAPRLAVLAMASVGAQAASSYGDLAAPGVYFDVGNINGKWNIGSAAGIRLGLGVKSARAATCSTARPAPTLPMPEPTPAAA